MKKGFTLIELLVVVLIIGILAAIALPQYTKTVKRTRAAGVEVLMDALKKANTDYQLTTGEKIAPTFDDLSISFDLTGVYNHADSGQCGYVGTSFICIVTDPHGARIHGTIAKNQTPEPGFWMTMFIEPKNGYQNYCMASTSTAQAKALCQSLGYKSQPGIYTYGTATTYVK
ncbi:type IV pilus assembly protein PilE [Elusimicrobium posterum]|uniref:type IV pilin protein n=1 Tax=Elusimicrobium posterum TaxID=3116653 RepID=UPI003C70B52C